MNTPPRPGQHRPGPHSTPSFADPAQIHADVDALLGRLDTVFGANVAELEAIPQQARILEQAHDVLVQALATVDKI